MKARSAWVQTPTARRCDVGSSGLRVLTLPGWLNSGPGHWQSHWERLHGCTRVQQDDWQWPRRGDWMARLDEVLLTGTGPVLLVAHSLGCHLVAAWAAHSRHGAQVHAAFLVAPPDLARDDVPPQLAGWRVPVRARLPFRAAVVYSDDDPFGTATSARALAADWGAEALSVGRAGHVNADSGLGDWPAGWRWVTELAQGPAAGP